MVVEEMNILTTVFLRADNLKIIFPNSQLALKCIYNHRRSPDMGDTVEFYVHIATPAEIIAAMKQRITRLAQLQSVSLLSLGLFHESTCISISDVMLFAATSRARVSTGALSRRS